MAVAMTEKIFQSLLQHGALDARLLVRATFTDVDTAREAAAKLCRLGYEAYQDDAEVEVYLASEERSVPTN